MRHLKLHKHQLAISSRWHTTKKLINLSEMGTGKTISCIDSYYKCKNKKRMLVLAPLAILYTSWLEDVLKYNSKIKAVVVTGTKAEKLKILKNDDYDIYITNHDTAVNINKSHIINRFSHLVIDEFTAYKHEMSLRSVMLKQIIKHFEYIQLLSGTPISTTVANIWYPVFLLDGGVRLGKNKIHFEYKYLDVYQGNFGRYCKLKSDSVARICNDISDMCIRYAIDDCVSIPEQEIKTISTDTPVKIKQIENNLACCYSDPRTRVLKLLQLHTGNYYDDDKNTINIDNTRATNIATLCNNSINSVVVAYIYNHQLQAIKQQINASYKVLNSSTTAEEKADIIKGFQQGKFKVLICQYKTISHGVTLTKATSVIWASPPFSSESFKQMNARIRRLGQDKETKVYCFYNKNTIEQGVYKILNSRVVTQDTMLQLLTDEY